jgi:hypothetical protein
MARSSVKEVLETLVEWQRSKDPGDLKRKTAENRFIEELICPCTIWIDQRYRNMKAAVEFVKVEPKM